jgi:hypothetical protein
LDHQSCDAVGYVAVDGDVMEYTTASQKMARSTLLLENHVSRMMSIIRLPDKPHSQRPPTLSRDRSLVQKFTKRLESKDRVTQIQSHSLRGVSLLITASDPLAVCLGLQRQSVVHFRSRFAKFRSRVTYRQTFEDGSASLNFDKLPLRPDTFTAIKSVTQGPIPLLGGKEGLVFEFHPFDPIWTKFAPSSQNL